MYPQPSGVAVRASMASIAEKTSTPTQSDTALLHERVCLAVDELKSKGWSVERIIVRLKEVANEVGFHPLRKNLSAMEMDRREALWDQTIKQCIDVYYAGLSPDP